MRSPTEPLRECRHVNECQLVAAGSFVDASCCSSLISFTPRQRFIGEAAKTAETSNFKNTVGSLKRLIGRTLNDPEVAEYEKKFINAELVDVNGSIGVKVRLALWSYSGAGTSAHMP